MPTASYSFTTGVYKNSDGLEMRISPLERLNCYLNTAQATARRPALSIIQSTFPNMISGVFFSPLADVCYVAAGSTIYRLDFDSSSWSLSPLTGTFLNGGALKANFVEFSASQVIAAQGAGMAIISPTSVSSITDPNAPGAVEYLDYLDGYIIATDGSNVFRWSNRNDPTTWNASNFASCEGMPDGIVGHCVVNRQIYFFGSQSIEIWENDGSNPFSRVPGGFFQIGVGANYSFARDDTKVYFFTNDRRFAAIEGRSIDIISTPFDDALQKLSNITDCCACLFRADGHKFISFTFPTDKRTFVYCITTESWSEFSQYSATLGNVAWPVRCGTYHDKLDTDILADFTDGSIYKLTSSNQDSGVSGSTFPIRWSFKSPNLTHETLRNKRSEDVRFVMKSGATQTTTDPYVMVRWRNDDSGTWSNERQLSLGTVGSRKPVKSIKRTGIYQVRQYHFVVSDSVPGLLAEMEEDFTVLR
jgi:hypothetical protein